MYLRKDSSFDRRPIQHPSGDRSEGFAVLTNRRAFLFSSPLAKFPSVMDDSRTDSGSELRYSARCGDDVVLVLPLGVSISRAPYSVRLYMSAQCTADCSVATRLESS